MLGSRFAGSVVRLASGMADILEEPVQPCKSNGKKVRRNKRETYVTWCFERNEGMDPCSPP